MSIDKDSSQEEKPLISLDEGNNESASIEWTEINVNDDDVDDLAEVVITDNQRESLVALGTNSPIAGNEPVDLKTPNTIEVMILILLIPGNPKKNFLTNPVLPVLKSIERVKQKLVL